MELVNVLTGKIDLRTDRAQKNEFLQQLLNEHADFTLCREIGCFPDDLERQPAELILKWKLFLSAENEAERRQLEEMKKQR